MAISIPPAAAISQDAAHDHPVETMAFTAPLIPMPPKLRVVRKGWWPWRVVYKTAEELLREEHAQ